MGMIKVPKQSIEFFKENIDDIFESGNLAEGKWNEKLNEFMSNSHIWHSIKYVGNIPFKTCK